MVKPIAQDDRGAARAEVIQPLLLAPLPNNMDGLLHRLTPDGQDKSNTWINQTPTKHGSGRGVRGEEERV